jgi:hypothetical protein
MKTAKVWRVLFYFLFFALLCGAALAQSGGYTAVTANVGSNYSGGTVTAQFANQSSSPTKPNLNGASFPQNVPTNISATGAFSLTLASNALVIPSPSQWKIIVCGATGAGPPCTPTLLTISGTSEDISNSLVLPTNCQGPTCSGAAVPTGHCTNNQIYTQLTTPPNLYACVNGGWQLGGSGGGGVIPATQHQLGQYNSPGTNIQGSSITTDATGQNLMVPGAAVAKSVNGELNCAQYSTPQACLDAGGAGSRVYFPSETYSTPGLAVYTDQTIDCASGSISADGGVIFDITGPNWAVYNPRANLTSGTPATNAIHNLKIHNCTFSIAGNSAALGGIYLKGSLWSQIVNVNVYTDGSQTNPAGIVNGGTYTSGITATGSGPVGTAPGQTCTLTSFNNGSTATATLTLTGTNTIASGTALSMTSLGTGATAAPTSATAGSGTATCSGTAVISTQLGAAAVAVVDGANGTYNGGAYFNDFYSFNSNDVGTAHSGMGIYLTNGANDTRFYGGSVNATGISFLADGANNSLLSSVGLEGWTTNCVHLAANGSNNAAFNKLDRVRCEAGPTNTNVSVLVDAGTQSNIIGVYQSCTECYFGIDATNGANSWEHTVIGSFAARKDVDIFGGGTFKLAYVGINKIPSFYDSYSDGGLDVAGEISSSAGYLLGSSNGGYSRVVSSASIARNNTIPDLAGTFAMLQHFNCTATPTGTPSSSTFLSGNCTWAAPPPTGIPSLNGSTGAQTVTGAGTISVSTVGGTTTISQTGAAGTGAVASFNQYQDAFGPNTGSSTTVGPNGNSSTVPTGLSGSQMQAAVNAQSGSVLHINGPEPPFANTSNNPVQDNRIGAKPWSVTSSGAACDAVLAFATVTASSTTITINSGYTFAATDADTTTPKWISMVGLVGGVPTRFDASITAASPGTTATMSAAAPFSVTDYSVTIGHDDTAGLAQAVSFAHNGDLRLQFPGNPSGSVCWSRTAALALSGAPMSGLPNGGILGGAGLDTTQGASGYLQYMQFYVDARIDATHPWNWDNNGTTTAQTPLYRPVGVMTPSANNPLGPGWIRGSEPYGLYAYNGVASTTSGSANMCVLSAAGSVPPVGADIVFPYLTSVLHTTVITSTGSCGTGTPVTLNAAIPATVAQAEYFWGEARGAAASGTAVQEINTAIPATGRTFPMTVNLLNPMAPAPGAESDFAPFGLVKIDGEEFQYYQTSSYPAVNGQWLQLTAGAQNGTSAAAHSVGAAIVPLNPFMPSLPWPVTTINGTGNQTPAGAEYYPAFNIGNAAIAQPVPDGTGFSGAGAFSESHIVGNTIAAWPNVGGSGENAYNFQSTNSTAGMYLVPLPFNSWFQRNNIAGPQFGIWEGVAAQNNHDYIGVPTSDTVIFDSNHISVGYSVGLIGGGTMAFTNNQLFSQNGPPNSGWYPYTPAAPSGSAVCAYMSAYGPDDTVGLNRGQYSWGSEIFDAQFSGNNYCEAETGALNTTQPIGVYDFSSTTWTGLSDMGGGVNYLGGTGNHISGGPFSQGDSLPLIIDGSNEVVDFASDSLANTGISNQWGASPVLAWGPNNKVTGGGAPSGDGRLSYGNSTATVDGQTNEFAATGNLTAPYVNSQGGFFAADTLNPVSQAGTGFGWTFDGTPANMTQGYSGCGVGTGVNTVQCSLFFNGRTQQAPTIGPGQAMAAGKYIWTMGLRESSGSAQTFGAYASTSCGYLDQTHTNIPISTTWTNVAIGVIDFSSATGCALQMTINGTSTAATSIEIGYISFVPVPQSVTLPVASPTDGAACSQPPGSIVGSDASFLYLCATNGSGGGVVKRAAIN